MTLNIPNNSQLFIRVKVYRAYRHVQHLAPWVSMNQKLYITSYKCKGRVGNIIASILRDTEVLS